MSGCIIPRPERPSRLSPEERQQREHQRPRWRADWSTRHAALELGDRLDDRWTVEHVPLNVDAWPELWARVLRRARLNSEDVLEWIHRSAIPHYLDRTPADFVALANMVTFDLEVRRAIQHPEPPGRD